MCLFSISSNYLFILFYMRDAIAIILFFQKSGFLIKFQRKCADVNYGIII